MQAKTKRFDPETSRMAARNYDMSNKRTQHFNYILHAMTGLFSLTSAEIAKLSPLDRFQVARRLSEMNKQGLVDRDGKKKCSIVKSECVAWKITQAGRDRIEQ